MVGVTSKYLSGVDITASFKQGPLTLAFLPHWVVYYEGIISLVMQAESLDAPKGGLSGIQP
eukprot:1162018-Pelagomonas_calceolata.AAC.7